VSAGEFIMGSDHLRYRRSRENEAPRHAVTLDAFEIATFPVTVAEYAFFERAGHPAPGKWSEQLRQLEHPVVFVSWKDALAYAQWLEEMSGERWRLPTEAEWEKAASWNAETGKARMYAWGDEFDTTKGNVTASILKPFKPITMAMETTPVGTYPSGASPCGALDMTGNIFEWTSSVFAPYPYDASDGREDLDAESKRVLRGGAWSSGVASARTAFRNSFSIANTLNPTFGFRLARTPS
jgi:formylglycine-generating enzyme required for sulfatase activity